MYRVLTLIFAGCIGLTGFVSHAQSPGRTDSIGTMIRSLTSGGTSVGTTSDLVGNITDQIMSTTEPTEQQTSAIEAGQRLVVDVEVPEINKTVVETIDTRTGRYPSRLKIDFCEFPLRSLAAKNGRSVGEQTQADVVAQRIQSRLRIQKIDLTVEDRTAIISGTVATERQRSLAESMLRFEPGIDAVHNKLTVVSP